MLARLSIHDVVLIDRLELELASGLNVFTGETGAGKSIVLDALGLAMGERSDAGLVKQDAVQASVTAEFHLADRHPVFTLAAEQGLTLEETVILRRVISKDGKSRAYINDQPISIGLLKQFGERLLEIHGQFETHGLLNAATHRGLLDSFGSLSGERNETAKTYAVWQSLDRQCREADANRTRARSEEEFLKAAVAELDQLSPEKDEAVQLAERRTTLQHQEKIIDALQAAEQALNGERGAIGALAQAGKAVARIADKAPGLNELLAAIDRAADETSEAATNLARVRASTDAEPDALQRIEERLFTLRAVARKHNVLVEALPELHKDLSNRLTLLSDEGDNLTALRKQLLVARDAYTKLAETLSDARQKAGQKLAKTITKELPPLKLERAQFTVDIMRLTEEQWSADGMDRVVFLAATNPGSTPGQLQKVASGGELARFMLALKVVLTAGNPVTSLVFDEVDSGIGGATASAVGERLARLAEDLQILVVTHSPQVAARGHAHIRVSKVLKNKKAITEVERLDDAARQEEIARMLAGDKITDAARQAAASLIDKTAQSSIVQRKTN